LHALSKLISRLDPGPPTRPPTLLTVVQLYCFKNLNVPQIARHCRCSIATVYNRLTRLRAITRLDPKQIIVKIIEKPPI